MPNRDRDQVEEAIERFAQTGSGDINMLAGEERQLRLRVGDWRSSAVCTFATAARHTVEPATALPPPNPAPKINVVAPWPRRHGTRIVNNRYFGEIVEPTALAEPDRPPGFLKTAEPPLALMA